MDADAALLADPDTAGLGAKEDRHFVTALARGLSVLACFGPGRTSLANHDIAEACGLPRSTVSRLTYTLTKLGYLQHLPEIGRYRLGTATIALSSAALGGLDVRGIARPVLRAVAEAANASVGLGVRDRLSMRYVDCQRGPAAISLNSIPARASPSPAAPWAEPTWRSARIASARAFTRT